jgi:hypothetical protein
LNPRVNLRSRNAAANAPVLQRPFREDDEDVCGRNAKLPEAREDALVQTALGFN